MSHRVLRLAEIEPFTTRHGFDVRLVRRTLGITAFGINAYEAHQAGGRVIEEHDELGSGAGRHEELYVVLSGHARFTVDGTDVDAPAGTLVFVPDPASRRGAIAVAPGTAVLVVGGRAGEPYRTPAYDGWLAAQQRADAGDHAAAIAILEVELACDPENATTFYNLACFEALAGRPGPARAHLARALEIAPAMADHAGQDPDLESLR